MSGCLRARTCECECAPPHRNASSNETCRARPNTPPRAAAARCARSFSETSKRVRQRNWSNTGPGQTRRGRRSAERISPRPHAVQRPCGAAKWSNRRTVKRSGQTAERPNPSGQATEWSEQTPAARRGTWPEPPATSSTPPFALLRRAVSAASKRS